MNPTLEQIVAMQQTILTRYKKNVRDLPRRHTTNPYKIRVSEVMSQQTQVSRVIPKYEARLERLPTIQDLATIDKHTLLSLWSGLGYNNRALRLQAAARIIVDEHHGKMPTDEKSLLRLPGIGAYTAHAIMAFAYNTEVPVIDINIKRVLIVSLQLPPDIKEKDLRNIAIACIPPGESRLWHNALMDYGALVLTAKKTWIKSAKQSKFVWSTRWVRGSLLKELVKHKTVSYRAMKKKYFHKNFTKILTTMSEEGIITILWDNVTLQS